MLRRFLVRNFKGFKDEFVFDLSTAKNYAFNTECVKDGIVNNAVIYGYNGCGKSNLGLAILDIVEHLTDNRNFEVKYIPYLNAAGKGTTAYFEYEFKFGESIVIYSYEKLNYKSIVCESLSIDGKEVISFDRSNGNDSFTCFLRGTENLNKTISDSELSVVKYVRNNSQLEVNSENVAFTSFMSFVEQMLFFRSLEDRFYIGLGNMSGTLDSYIIKEKRLKDFEVFLHDANIDCTLAVGKDYEGNDTICFDYGKKKIPIKKVSSTGTNALMLFYCWYLHILHSEVSFVFIDEFDAFYHYELSRLVIEKLKETGIQFVLTTHNTSVMSNDIMRPDCYYLMSSKVIKPLSLLTDKELREAHNIEKIYKSGAFDVK